MSFPFFMKKRATSSKKEPIPEKRPTLPAKKVPDFDKKVVYAFIDASNLFWGGRESLGFKINYRKLLDYLADEFNVSKAFYYGGVRIFDFEYSILDDKPIDLAKLMEHLKELQKNSDEKEGLLIERALNKINFYQRLEEFGYVMKIKPAKVSYDEDDEERERPILKANCDVDMTFDMMRLLPQYSGAVAMTGDGDFAPVLNYLKKHERFLTVISRWDRTAKEIREIAGDDFVDFSRLKHKVRLNY